MRARDKHLKYVVASEGEWLEIAANLPRNSHLRNFCIGRSQTKGETWAELGPEEWTAIEGAAAKAQIEIKEE